MLVTYVAKLPGQGMHWQPIKTPSISRLCCRTKDSSVSTWKLNPSLQDQTRPETAYRRRSQKIKSNSNHCNCNCIGDIYLKTVLICCWLFLYKTRTFNWWGIQNIWCQHLWAEFGQWKSTRNSWHWYQLQQSECVGRQRSPDLNWERDWNLNQLTAPLPTRCGRYSLLNQCFTCSTPAFGKHAKKWRKKP